MYYRNYRKRKYNSLSKLRRTMIITKLLLIGVIIMVILGISGIFNHDAAACIIQDDKIIAMVEEERLIRRKRAYKALPIESTKYCLHQAGIEPEEIDILAVSWDPSLFKNESYDENYLSKFINNPNWRGRLKPQIVFVPHHVAHAASSYYISNIDSGVIIVVDGHGEDVSTSIGYCEKGRIRIDSSHPISSSLGHFYETVSSFLGLGNNSSGKMMGLASYGKEKHLFDDLIQVDSLAYNISIMQGKENDGFHETRSLWMKYLANKFGSLYGNNYEWDSVTLSSRYIVKEFDEASNIAASAQFILEDTVIRLIKNAFEKYNTRNLMLAGGVALNCSMNGRIIRDLRPDQFFVCPASNDAGVALGAALFVLGKKISDNFTPYLGPENKDSDIKALLNRWNLKYCESSDISEDISNFLADNKTIGLIQGRGEIGPRALGNRSIIALPIGDEIRDRVNDIKCREKWRPLSPSLITENAIPLLGENIDSKYMLEAHYVKSLAKTNIRGAVHIDDTCRPQVVSRSDNPIYYDIIKKVYNKTGVMAVMNTSFNDASEPMVLSSKDAVRTFMASPLDVLVIGNNIIIK